jgi:hypothetical protein
MVYTPFYTPTARNRRCCWLQANHTAPCAVKRAGIVGGVSLERTEIEIIYP